MSDPHWQEAHTADVPPILALMADFYAEDHLAFDRPAASAALHALLKSRQLGQVFILRDFETAATLGYLALTFGFSLEFHGRFVLLDELYLHPAMRGQGWGRRTLEFVDAWALRQNAATVRIEVNHANVRARALYDRHGFKANRRDFLTRWLPGVPVAAVQRVKPAV